MKLWRGWYAVGALACVCAFPTKELSNRMYVSRTKLTDLDSLATSYAFEDIPREKFIELIDDGLEDFTEGTTSSMKPPTKSSFAVLSRILEPEAEVLPAHYSGVKSPGVDHMELVQDPSILATDPKKSTTSAPVKSIGFAGGHGARAKAAKKTQEASKGEEGRAKSVAFERRLKDDLSKENRKIDYEEAAGKKKSHAEEESHVSGHKDELVDEKGAVYEIEGKRDKGHNAVGYHNVYHKDEYKKDADFYDNDHHGGHYKKHGRYGEKHLALEGILRKGGSQDAGFDQAKIKKDLKLEKATAIQDSQGHAAAKGYDGFFRNFDDFASKDALVQAKRFGFADFAKLT